MHGIGGRAWTQHDSFSGQPRSSPATRDREEASVPNPTVLIIEKHVGVAHQALWSAAQRAELLRDQGLSDDLRALCIELERLQTALLKRGPAARCL